MLYFRVEGCCFLNLKIYSVNSLGAVASAIGFHQLPNVTSSKLFGYFKSTIHSFIKQTALNRACKSRARKRGWGQEIHIHHVNI